MLHSELLLLQEITVYFQSGGEGTLTKVVRDTKATVLICMQEKAKQ